MDDKKFDPKKLAKLNNLERLKTIPMDYIWEKLNPKKAETIIEIGAGTGLFCKAILEKSKANKVYACDLSDMMIDWMNENIAPNYPAIIPLKTEEVNIPLENEIADIVFSINLHHELEHPEQSLNEARRLLKPDGKIFIIDWNKKSPMGPPIHIRSSTEQVNSELKNTGFKNITSFNDLPMHFFVIGEK